MLVKKTSHRMCNTGLTIDMSRAFKRYIGVDYSGAETPTSSLKGLRLYEAYAEIISQEVQPPPSAQILDAPGHRGVVGRASL